MGNSIEAAQCSSQLRELIIRDDIMLSEMLEGEAEFASGLLSPELDPGDLDKCLETLDDVEVVGSVDSATEPNQPHNLPAWLTTTKHRFHGKREDGTLHNDRPVRRAVQRRRQKEEIDMLRSLVKDLELQLQQLQQHAAAPCTAKPEVESGAEGTMTCASLWERTAQRQKDERLRAEVENTKLRMMLEGQLRTAQSLDKLLHKRPPNELFSTVHCAPIRSRGCRSDRKFTIFDEIETRLDSIYLQLEAVWLETGLLVNQEELLEAEVKTDGAHKIFLEVLNSRIIPFSVSKSSAAIWKLLSGDIRVGDGVVRAFDVTEDTTKLQITLTLQLRRSEAYVEMSMMVKRYVEAGRVVFVCACEGRTEGGTFGDHSIDMSETAWAVVDHHVPSSTNSTLDDTSSLFQFCSRIWITPNMVNSSQQKVHVSLLTEMIVASYSANMRGLIQNVENFLVDELLL